jgi:hypothetical protein
MLKWFKTNHQALTAIGAMVVGVAALYVAWDQARVMRAQQHGAVVPALQIDPYVSSPDGSFTMGIRVNNNGVGPAFVESVEVLRDGEVQASLDPLVTGMPSNLTDRSWSSMNGRVIAPGEEVTALRLSWAPGSVSGEQANALLENWDHWDLRICYCSVFDRCWTASVLTLRDEPTRHCPVQTIDVFEDFGRPTPDSPETDE